MPGTNSIPGTAAAYIRVSDDKQDEYSPDSQLKLIRDYAKRNGYYVPDEFVFYDDGISAKTAAKRPKFIEMIGIAKQKNPPFDKILVWKFSRFARNQEESIVYKSLLRKNGVEVISISEPLIDGAFGSLIERIIEWMDEYYLVRLSGEVKRGMKEKASRGEAMSGRVFGYLPKDGTLFPHTEEAPLVRMIFDDYLNGKGARQIATKLQQLGVKTIRGNDPDNRFVDYVLHNPVYCGKVRWSTDGCAASKRDYNNENIMLVNGSFEPIISEQTFNAAQNKIADQKKRYPKYQRNEAPTEYMLRGLVRCDSCGATLTLQRASKALQCHNYARGSCKVSHSIAIAKANKTVIEALQYAVDHLDFNILPDEEKHTPEDYSKPLAALRKKLARTKEAYINGVDTLEEYKENKQRITEEIAKLEKKQAANTALPEVDKEAFAAKVRGVIAVINSPDTTEQAKNEALRSVLAKIIYHKPAQSLELYFYA